MSVFMPNPQSDKLLLKKILASGIYHLGKIFNRKDIHKNAFRILMYHSVSKEYRQDPLQKTIPLFLFKEQMEFLREDHYCILSCEEIIERFLKKEKLPPKTVAITFDDGFRDNLDVLPIIKEYEIPITVFLVTDFIGKNENYLNWSDIQMLFKEGLVSFGAHTLSHPNLKNLNRIELEREIGLPKKIISDYLKREIILFAYPYGGYGFFDKRMIELIKSFGYKAAFTSISGVNQEDSFDAYQIRRTRISWFDDRKEFSRELKGVYDCYAFWQRIQQHIL